jgi:CDP-glycerol glycerophosphotransferase (TagB/SpsB family)
LLLLRILRPGRAATWVIGGHSGRLYADNAAALHELLLAEGQRDLVWISAEPAVDQLLRQRGARVLRRNSLRARIAIENARVLAYSHGLTDLDHVLQRRIGLRGLKVHLNHCMSHLKAWNSSRFPEAKPSAAPGMPFDFLLASSERERANLARSFQGADARIVVGGGAHLDTFMRARGRQPGRLITYFPTFRETPAARAQLEANIAALASHAGLASWLAQHDYTLRIVSHVNTGAPSTQGDARVRFASPQELGPLLTETELLISDYSGLICDYLALDRPIIFFPFDKTEYLAQRTLYVDYDDFAFGPQVASVDELIALIISGRFRAGAAYEAKRRRWEQALFPSLVPTYAERTRATIHGLSSRHVATS